MSGVRAKICGVTTPAALNAAIAGGASHVGFVLFPPSPRNLSFDTLAGLAAQVPASVGKVGVFVDPEDALIESAMAAGRLDAIQLHRTRPERAAALRTRAETWVAVAVKTAADIAGGQAYRGTADRLLYDAKTPDAAALPGGMGIRFDWSLMTGVQHPLPWLLSGGLDAGNVADAVARTGARLVDVSSGVEDAPGVKSVDKIGAFLQAVSRL